MADKKKGAIFRMETIDGKLYRVMYFKNDRGGLTRSKFIREVQPKKPGRPKKATRATKNAKMIMENRSQINNNTRTLQKPKKPVVHSHSSKYKRGHPHMNKSVPASKFKRPESNKYVRRSSNANKLIDKWKNLGRK